MMTCFTVDAEDRCVVTSKVCERMTILNVKLKATHLSMSSKCQIVNQSLNQKL